MIGVSRSAYYRYLRGDSYQLTPEKTTCQRVVEQVFAEHRRCYGSRRITSELQQKGI
ncbi:IS3 family transposase [Spirosoma terrae]|uniref:IS3 family transposase n=1 Tax=Spirosoma terrae TaxID=1968276 RepID=UPI00374254C2